MVNKWKYLFLTTTQLFIPFFSVWNTALLLHEYIDSAGHETLFIQPRIKVFFNILKIYCLLFFNIGIVCIILTFLYPDFYLEFFRLISASFLFFWIIFFFLLKSIAFSFLISLVYLIINSYYRDEDIPMVFMSENLLLPHNIIHICLPLLVVGIILVSLGIILLYNFCNWWYNCQQRNWIPVVIEMT